MEPKQNLKVIRIRYSNGVAKWICDFEQITSMNDSVTLKDSSCVQNHIQSEYTISNEELTLQTVKKYVLYSLKLIPDVLIVTWPTASVAYFMW